LPQAYGQPLDVYRQSAVNTASPVELIVMLYDGALRALDAALLAMEQRDLQKQHDNLIRAQRIISELQMSLNMEHGGEIAVNLLALYSYVNNQLVDANINDDPKPIHEVAKLLAELRDSWATISSQVGRQAPVHEAA
jgi:flagellar protein FliS